MVIMAHARAKGQGQRSLRSKVKVETVGQTDGGDCITFPANAVGNNVSTILCYCAHQKYGLE